MKKNAKIFLIICFIIIAVAVFYTNNRIKNTPKPVSKFDEIMLYDFENEYPQTPEELISLNDKIITYIYSENILDEEIEPLLNIQKNLFAKTLIDLNNENEQLESTKEQIKSNKDNKLWIVNTKLSPTQYSENSKSICTINVLYYMSRGSNIERNYTLIKEENKNWKIFRWEDIQKDVTTTTEENSSE